MTIKPSDRPQSIQEWLALFGKKEGDDPITDDEATRFFAHEVSSEEITPVAPPAPGYEPKELETQVPDDPNEVQFKRAGEETGAKKNKKGAGDKDEGASDAAAAAAATGAAAALVAGTALADDEEGDGRP